MAGALEGANVRRVREALLAAGADDTVVELAGTARSAADAAASVGCALGAIVKTLVFRSGDRPVLALVAGDRRCDVEALRQALSLPEPPGQADGRFVREATGFAIGGVPPVGHEPRLATAIDASLRRFDKVYAAAGHPFCVFETTPDRLVALTGGVESDRLGT